MSLQENMPKAFGGHSQWHFTTAPWGFDLFLLKRPSVLEIQLELFK